MHQLLLPDQLAARAKALGWPLGRLADVAGLHRTTFTRSVAGASNIRLATLQALTEALVAHELRLRDHLVALHGVPGAVGGNGAAQAPHPDPLPASGAREKGAAA